MGTTDFRVGSKIFATLGNPDAAWGVIGLTPDQTVGCWGDGRMGQLLPAVGSDALREAGIQVMSARKWQSSRFSKTAIFDQGLT